MCDNSSQLKDSRPDGVTKVGNHPLPKTEMLMSYAMVILIILVLILMILAGIFNDFNLLENVAKGCSWGEVTPLFESVHFNKKGLGGVS